MDHVDICAAREWDSCGRTIISKWCTNLRSPSPTLLLLSSQALPLLWASHQRIQPCHWCCPHSRRRLPTHRLQVSQAPPGRFELLSPWWRDACHCACINRVAAVPRLLPFGCVHQPQHIDGLLQATPSQPETSKVEWVLFLFHLEGVEHCPSRWSCYLLLEGEEWSFLILGCALALYSLFAL